MTSTETSTDARSAWAEINAVAEDFQIDLSQETCVQTLEGLVDEASRFAGLDAPTYNRVPCNAGPSWVAIFPDGSTLRADAENGLADITECEQADQAEREEDEAIECQGDYYWEDSLDDDC